MNLAQPTHFWQTLPRPIIGLSPMNSVTDHPFRHIQKKHGKPMILFTEFTSVDGICAGASALLKDFLYDESQRPIIAQIYGRTPQNFYQTALLVCQLGFDGIDINMGCPSKSIAHAGSGAGLIRTPHLAQEIIRATQQAVCDWQNGATVRDCVNVPLAFVKQVEKLHNALPSAFQQRRALPVSVKTRLGYSEPQVAEWIPYLLDCEPAAITLHGRTLTQGYTGDANWDEIGKAATMARGSATLMLGNGDLDSLTDAHQRIAAYGLDGALIGRASYGNPHIFNRAQSDDSSTHDRYEILKIAQDHARLYHQSFSHLERYNFLPMRKHLGWYVRHLPGASHLRRILTQTCTLDQALHAIDHYLTYRTTWEN